MHSPNMPRMNVMPRLVQRILLHVSRSVFFQTIRVRSIILQSRRMTADAEVWNGQSGESTDA